MLPFLSRPQTGGARFLALALGCGLTISLCGGESKPASLVASPEAGWPQWRGPLRDGLSTETGLLPSWPEGGPRQLWKVSGLGRGYSAPIITGGRIYLAGDVGPDLVLFALDLEGRTLWRATNGASWKTPYPGARASCTFAAGRVLHMNAHARVGCYEAATGRELWAVDLKERFGSGDITWATSENLLVDGSRVIVTAGGAKSVMAALDLKTGTTVWAAPPLILGASPSPAEERATEPAGAWDPPSYASPILVEMAGRRQIIGCSQRHVFGVDASTGQLLWSRPVRTRHQVVAMTPVLVGDAVFVTAPHTEDRKLHRVREAPEGLRVEEVWQTKLDTCHGGVVLVGDALYGSWYGKRGWACLDAATGRVRYESAELAKGSILYADRRLYVLSEEGEMALLQPTAAGFKFEGRFRLVNERANDVWTHPVIQHKRLYLRHHEDFFCYDLSRGVSESGSPQASAN